MKRKSFLKIKSPKIIILILGIIFFGLYFNSLKKPSDGFIGIIRRISNVSFVSYGDDLYFSIFGDRKKIIVVDHGEEMPLYSRSIIRYIFGSTIETVGDVIRILDIPLTRNQSRAINLCKKIEDLADDEKIIINADAYQRGVASWYGPGFIWRTTANGERFSIYKSTAAHKTLPFDTMVRVFNVNNNKSIIVRINDRGPFVAGRIIDLSFKAKRELGMDQITSVYLEILDRDTVNQSCD